MMICLYPNGCKELIVMFWVADCEAYATIDNDIPTTKAHIDEDIV
jgi:hypothetical protein